jgi:two-component system, NarL family, sensor kinase
VNLTSLIIIGIAAMLALAMGVILFVVMYQRKVIRHQVELKQIEEKKELELIQASIQSEEQERMRIATELHDDVGATLASARLFLHQKELMDESAIQQSKELLDESIQKIRSISHKLQPSTLYHLGLQTSLQSLSEIISKTGVVKVVYVKLNDLPRLDAQLELSAYRVVQELMNNCIKHANAQNITMQADANGELKIKLSHDGKGLLQQDYEELIYKKGAIGLKNIVNRLKSINANISFDKDGDWYTIAVAAPLIPANN